MKEHSLLVIDFNKKKINNVHFERRHNLIESSSKMPRKQMRKGR